MRRRTGLSLLEIVVAMAVLGIGLLPVLDLFGTTRAVLGRGRDTLALQSRALEAVTRARARLSRGEVRGLGAEGVREDSEVVGELTVTTRIQAQPRRGLFHLKVRVEGDGRWFELGQVVAFPGGSYLGREAGS